MEWKKKEGTSYWMPEKENDELVGEVKAVNTEGQYGNQYLIETEDGNQVLTPSHKVLQNRLVGIDVGQKVKIVYTGTEPPAVKGHKPTSMYDVFVGE